MHETLSTEPGTALASSRHDSAAPGARFVPTTLFPPRTGLRPAGTLCVIRAPPAQSLERDGQPVSCRSQHSANSKVCQVSFFLGNRFQIFSELLSSANFVHHVCGKGHCLCTLAGSGSSRHPPLRPFLWHRVLSLQSQKPRKFCTRRCLL